MKTNQQTPRKWQSQHSEKAIAHFRNGGKVFLSQAVTGAGKTTLGVMITTMLLNANLISRVVVLCPSIEISEGWKTKFEKYGVIASTENIEASDVVAVIFTYQGGNKAIGNNSTLVVLDEIHHAEREASWGLLADSTSTASKFVLALTGTPWMTKGKIAILDKHDYYVDGKIDVSNRPDGALYSYEEDLRSNNGNRATVPLKCHFFESEAIEKVGNNDGSDGQPLVRLKLEKVTEENIKKIVTPGPHHDAPLGPHVTIRDNILTGNNMAMNLLIAAINARYEMENSAAFKGKKKPMGLITCRTIKEARYIGQFLSSVYSETCEVIVSEDEGSAKRLRDIANDKIQPNWIISVGMVSEGVDIPAIKVIAFLNAITTVLFLIQLIGRALRRVPFKKDGVEQYLDHSLTETVALLFAPAHPAIVKVATELEHIGNQAIVEKSGPTEPSTPPEEPKPVKEYDVTGDAVTTFYRGIEMGMDTAKMLEAITSDPDAMQYLGPVWSDMIHQWIESGREDDAKVEMQLRIDSFNVIVNKEKKFSDSLNYDTESRLLRLQAENVVQRIRFSHPFFSSLSDSVAYSQVRIFVCEKAFGPGVFKPIKKMSMEEKRHFVDIATKVLRREV